MLDFQRNFNFIDIFSKNSQIYSFMQARPVGGAELFHMDRRTYGHDDSNSRFPRFCERAQKFEILTHLNRALDSSLRERNRDETKMAREYCWAITQAAGRSCCRPSADSVLKCIYYIRIYRHTVDNTYIQFRLTHDSTRFGSSATLVGESRLFLYALTPCSRTETSLPNFITKLHYQTSLPNFITKLHFQSSSPNLITKFHHQTSLSNFITNFITKLHYQTSLPNFITKLHHQTSLPNFITKLHYQTSSPNFTTKLHHQTSLPNFISKSSQCSGGQLPTLSKEYTTCMKK